MTIAYSKYFSELDSIIVEAKRILDATSIPEHALLEERISEARKRITSEASIRIAIIGEWNSGKSSLIKALTGADAKIDSDVCTGISTEYAWQGMVIVDTPGVLAEGTDTDHDRIARKATIDADLVLFVVTNELFNPRLANHLRFILDENGLALAKKTALIVNKVDRESNPEEILLGEIQKVIGPHQNIPVYFCAASKLLRAENEPPELRDRFVAQSRIGTLTQGIDQFVDDAGTFGRLATPLQIIEDIADSLQTGIVASEDGKKQLELIRRKKTVLQGLQRRLLDIRKTWKQHAYSTILGQAEHAVGQIDDLSSGDDLDGLLATGMKQAIAEIENLHDSIKIDIDEALDDAERKLDEIGDSPLAKDIDRAHTERAELIGVDFHNSSPGGNGIAAKLGKVAATPLKEGLEAAAKNAEGLRDLVYNVGKAVGKKFRPWEAVKSGEKLARLAGKAGKAVPYLAAALDLYLQYREEKVKEENAKYLAGMRIALRNAFADQAKVEAEALEAGIVRVSEGPVSAALSEIDSHALAITEAAADKATLFKEIGSLRARCTRLRTHLMTGVH